MTLPPIEVDSTILPIVATATNSLEEGIINSIAIVVKDHQKTKIGTSSTSVVQTSTLTEEDGDSGWVSISATAPTANNVFGKDVKGQVVENSATPPL